MLEFQWTVWTRLLQGLRDRGQGRRESGAFLLGLEKSESKSVRDIVPYEDMDRDALNYDYVRLSSDAFSRLWCVCEERGLQVVGDVHTHPFGPVQSPSDRAHPMIALAGHVALIVPRFATGHIVPADLSVNVYFGSGRWRSYLKQEAAARIKILEATVHEC